MTDGRTDGQTDARGKTICLPTLSGGDIILKHRHECQLRKMHVDHLYQTGCTESRFIFFSLSTMFKQNLFPCISQTGFANAIFLDLHCYISSTKKMYKSDNTNYDLL